MFDESAFPSRSKIASSRSITFSIIAQWTQTPINVSLSAICNLGSILTCVECATWCTQCCGPIAYWEHQSLNHCCKLWDAVLWCHPTQAFSTPRGSGTSDCSWVLSHKRSVLLQQQCEELCQRRFNSGSRHDQHKDAYDRSGNPLTLPRWAYTVHPSTHVDATIA